MIDAVVLQAEQVWPSVAKILYIPRNEAEYDKLVEILDHLIDQIGGDETHPLASLMEIIGILIEQYEDEHVPQIGDL